MRKIKIKQHDISDCGAACLASCAAYYNRSIPLARIRQLASTDQKGTNLLGLLEASSKMGFKAKAVKGPFESLFQIPKPSILHLVVNDVLHHYVVLYQINKKHVKLMDPSQGRFIKISHNQFKNQWTGVILLLQPNEIIESLNKTSSVISRFFKLISPHKAIMAQAVFGAMIYSILGLSTSLFVQNIVDHVIPSGNTNLLHLMGVIMVIILLVKIYINSMKGLFALKTGQKIDANLLLGYYNHLMTLPQRFFDTMRVGEIISRVNDAVKIRAFINNVSLDLIVNILIVTFTLSLMFVLSWKLALLVAICIPIYISLYFVFNRLNKIHLRTLMESSAELETHLVESLNNISTIKQLNGEVYANTTSESKLFRLLKNSYTSSRNSIIFSNATELIAGAITISLLWLGSKLVLQNEISPGRLFSFYAMLTYLLAPLGQLIQYNQSIQDALIAADRLFQIMDLEREEHDDKLVTLSKEMVGDIKFKAIHFRYGTRVNVFQGLSLNIKHGTTTAIVGESGSGKTSLAALLQKLYPIQQGSIEIGKYNIQHISNSSLRKLIGVVPQKIELFAGTVVENIAFGTFEPDMKHIIDICQFLDIAGFIEKLPGGYQAYLGEQGVSLSGGERQRLAIARALYHQPEILILDEATSALDSTSEAAIKRAIESLKAQQKTIIIIAHRLSTIMHADQICVLHQGQLAEEGSHSELLSKQGLYYKLWAQQVPELEGVPL